MPTTRASTGCSPSSFPIAPAKERFFADARYGAVRARFFVPAVAEHGGARGARSRCGARAGRARSRAGRARRMTPAAQRLLDTLGINVPIMQAPMAGVDTGSWPRRCPTRAALARSASARSTPPTAATMIGARARADRCAHSTSTSSPIGRPSGCGRARPHGWRGWRRTSRAGAEPPTPLREIYTSFIVDEAMLATLLAERPPVVSFHFGLPPHARHPALRRAGIVLLAIGHQP